MINGESNPIEWAQLMYELEDAHEHLDKLIAKMRSAGSIDIESYKVEMAHIYAHLNRAWNSRNSVEEMSESLWDQFRCFPRDLEPLA